MAKRAERAVGDVQSPPQHIDLVYRKVGETHVFASKGIRGLVHVGHTDLHTACERVLTALGVHVSNTYGVEARYVCEHDFNDFASKVDVGASRFLGAKLDSGSRAAA